MSSSPLLRIGGVGFVFPAAAPRLDNGVVRVASLQGQASRLEHSLVILHGAPPEEQPFLYHLDDHYHDRRDVAPLALRFLSQQPEGGSSNGNVQDGIRAMLWPVLRQLLGQANCVLPDDLPTITFDEVKYNASTSYSRFTLQCPTVRAFESIAQNVREVRIDDLKRIYKRTLVTNTLPRDIFIFEIVNLPLADLDPEALFLSLATMTTNTGTLLGIAKVVAPSSEWGALSANVRGYVELTGPWLAAPLQQLALQLPTDFKWHGFSYKMLYAGRDVHQGVVESFDFPLNHPPEGEVTPSPSP